MKAVAKKMRTACVAMRAKRAHLGSLFLPTITITVMARNAESRGVVSTIKRKPFG